MKDKTNNRKFSELNKLETWDTEKLSIRQPKKASRVVFSVAFSPDDFELVTKYAELCGMKTSKFISEVAIQKATGQGELSLRGISGEAKWLNGEEKPIDTTKHEDLILSF